ncbi:hypothetical protein ZYGM_002026 [Zygosaccharomyces mellis]|uniref:Monooxygenase n=1 Tax=Zygosaccharomyces mellis TaxID=42258 RepID=A0A4C2E9V1_9SACH|nr:hypothetical protein ZYGM_002026 [Zygosaccharomyces mellis]
MEGDIKDNKYNSFEVSKVDRQFSGLLESKKMCTIPRLAIIGAGPAGLSTTRVFLANASNFKIQLFEKDYAPGGLWHYPQHDKRHRVMYDQLETNISKHLMKFSGFPFPHQVPHFPWRQDVYGYLDSYYKRFIQDRQNVVLNLNTSVISLSKDCDIWRITTRNNTTGREQSQEFDHVVVANGHYDRSYIPDTPGLQDWLDHGAAIHSRDFQNCGIGRDKNVVVVGSGSSGSDILNQVWTVANKVYLSTSNVETHELATVIPRIKQVNWPQRSVQLTNGEKLENIDLLIYSTGYLFSYPFFDANLRKDVLATTSDSTERLYNLWQQIFYVKDPTLAFSLLPGLIIPFPLAELQASLMVKVFTNKLKVPNLPDDELYKEQLSQRAKYHQISDFKDIDYYRQLQSLLNEAGGQNDPFKPVIWDDNYKAMRENGPQDKSNRQQQLVPHLKQLKSQHKDYRLLDRSS